MQLHVERRGEGKPILLLHGLMSDHRQVEPLLPALKGCKAVMPDLPGCGKSEAAANDSLIQNSVDELKKLCKKENIDTVIGYSLGGLFAIELGLPNTVLISTFCTNPALVGPLQVIRGREKRVAELIRKNEAATERFLRKYAKSDNKLVPGISEASVPCARLHLLACEEDRTAKAEKLKHVLVIHGTEDRLVNHKLGMQLAMVSNAEFVVVPEGHFSVLGNETVHQAISVFVAASSLA